MSNVKIQYDSKFYDCSFLPGEKFDSFLERAAKEIIQDEFKFKTSNISFKPRFNKVKNITVYEMSVHTRRQ